MIPACLTENSDGFAAFPIVEGCDVGFAKKAARENALNEAIERFVWATWWDQQTCAHIKTKYKTAFLPSLELLEIVEEHTPILSLFRIEPLVTNCSEITTIIFFAELRNGGYISGGAAGTKKDVSTIEFRAISEMMRHSIGLSRAINEDITPQTLYEKRLLHFGTQRNAPCIKERLASTNKASIILPPLLFDDQIPHLLSGSVIVHRCLFQNQPPFVGGELERLCL